MLGRPAGASRRIRGPAGDWSRIAYYRDLVPQVMPGPTGFAFFKAEKRLKETVTWAPRTPHIHDVVKTVDEWDEPRLFAKWV